MGSYEQWLHTGAQHLVRHLLARLLSPADYGIIGILTIFTLIAGNLQSSGFTQALVNLKHPTDRDYNSVFWFNVIVSFALYVVLFFSAPLIAAFPSALSCMAVALRVSGFFISSFGIVQNAYMTKNMMNKEIAIVSFVALISSNVVGVCLAFNGMAYWSLAWQQVIFITVLNFGRFYYTGWRPQLHIDFGPVRQMFAFSVKLLITNIINTVSNNVLTFIFGRFYPIDDVGNYSQAYNWNTKANSFISNTVGQIAQPVLSSVKDDRGKEQQVFRKMFRFTSFLSFPLMFGLALVSHEFILITISDKWIASVPAADSQRERSLRSAVHTLSEPRHQQRTIGCLHVVQSGAGGRIAGVGALLSQLRHLLDGCGLHSLYDIVAAGVAGCHQTHHRLALQDVCLDTLPFLFCAAGCMVATYYLTCWLSNIYLLLLVRIIWLLRSILQS